MMRSDRIIGRVGATVLAGRLANARQADGSLSDSAALFRLDKLSPTQIAAIVREIISNPQLSSQVDIKIPLSLVGEEGLPEHCLTDLNAGAVRNIGTNKEALLTANGNEHNLADTLGHVAALGAKELRENESAWVEATCHVASIVPTQDDRVVFTAALRGLIAVTDLSLIQLSEFCQKVSESYSSPMGYPIRDALGWSLPFVGLPRDTSFFSNSKTYGSAAAPWRKSFEKLYAQRAPLLSRQRANGQPLDADEMRQRMLDNIESIEVSVRNTLEIFIDSPVGDQSSMWNLALLEWEKDNVHLIFEKPRERQRGLAESTIYFFAHDCSDTDVLAQNWLKHLEDMKTRERRSEWNEDDEVFFEAHRRYIEQDPKLHAQWEKVVFGKPIECSDFFEGMVTAAHQLIAGAIPSPNERLLRVTVNKGRKDWRERFNHDVGAYFSVMYRGLRELLGAKVDWKVERLRSTEIPDPLFQYPEFFKWEIANRKDKPKRVSSVAKNAVQIKFEVALIERRGDVEDIVGKTQLMWVYKPQSIGLALFEDMVRIQEKGSVACTEVPRRLVSKKGGVQSVSLLDTATLEATFSRDAGSLVPPPNKLRSLRAEIKRKIDDLANEGRISQDQRGVIRAAWDKFESDYIKAIDDFINIGLHGEAVLEQAESFAGLLKALGTHARGDVCRSRLIADVLSIGTVRVSGDQPCVIIPPWHPERMKALAVKTRRVAGLVSYILSGKNVLFGDRGIFFREFSEELIHPFYPEVAVFQRNGSSILVSESSTVNGYSLMERPVQGEDDSLTDVDPTSAAKQVQELLARYVGLQPHESSNLSVLLYNADAAELPLAVVQELANLQFESNLQCGVAVRHRDPAKLRRVYAELVTKAGDNPDLPVVSETSENFISKLRISVVPASATPVKGKSSFKPYDIAFLHDVVSRTASAEWIPVDWTNDCSSLEHAPSRWSYRSVSGENELKSTTFLTCPRQTASGWVYVNTVGSVVRQTDLTEGQYYLPARRISLQSESLREALDDVHSLAEWVATYDELLDKRQLQSNGVTVVRYRRASTNGRNMIVSSTSELRLLGVLIRRRLSELGLSLDAEEVSEVSSRMKRDALSVSGDIVLRAAKRGVSAGEMLGLVLSRYLLENEFKKISGSENDQAFSVYFLLDDYADWLAQKESRIADILGLRVEEREGIPHLHIAVIESKYVNSHGAAEARRSSKAQLIATLATFRAALFGDPGRLDRDVWLSRLADLLLDADIPAGCSGLLERARSSLRDGSALISLRGYSHIFVHDIENVSGQLPTSEQFLIDDSDGIQAWQEVFERTELRSLVEAFAHKADPTQVRMKLGSAQPWDRSNARPPAARVAWTTMMDLLPSQIVANLDDVKTQTKNLEVKVDTDDESVSTSSLKKDATLVDSGSSLSSSNSSNQIGAVLSGLISSKIVGHSTSKDERDEWAEETTKKLKTALNGYGFHAAILGTRLTPNGCLVRLAGSDRLRVEDIEAKRTQLLTTHAINLVTVQPKPGEIVVTIASSKRQSVSMWDLWSRRTINRNAAGINTSFVLGLQEINGTLLYLNLGGEFGGLSSHEPHSLVAGATGSGKSVLLQAILLDIAATNPANLAQIILIDPKMGVDYSSLEDLPHMREKIVTTRERATEVLSSLVEEMENRYRLFASARARDLTTFNAKSAPEDRLPMLFLVHDEFADWMLDDGYKGAVSAAVQRLGVKARAAGIHLIFAAQRPDKDVMPMQLRENLGNRLILKVASEATSKIALDRSGAELLLGKGHLAAKLNGEQGLVFAQAPFLSDIEIDSVVDAIRKDAHDFGTK